MTTAADTAKRNRAMSLFKTDLNVVMDDIRGMMAHYQIQDWEAYVFLRKPGCPESYVLNYEPTAGDVFAQRIADLHRLEGEPVNPKD